MRPWVVANTDLTGTNESHGEATREQLYDCAILLALSVVQHRAKFGVVPIEQAVPEFHASKDRSGSTKLLAEGMQTLDKALKLAKTPPAIPSDSRTKGSTQKVELEEKRQQIRISVSAPIYVVPIKGTTPLKAKLENISWGGAALHIDQPVGDVGEYVLVMLPSFQGRRITVQAQILRTWEMPEGIGYGVRFTKVRTEDEELLEQFLVSLAESGDDTGQRGNARLTRRIDIQYDDSGEFQATLEDISAGGIGITVPEPMELNQSILAAISTTDEECQLLLRARVVRQQELKFSEITMFRVGLEFEHHTEDVKKRVNELIRKLATSNSYTKMPH